MENLQEFMTSWDRYMNLGGVVSLAVAFLIFIYHEIKVISVRDLKDRYDYVNLHEIRFFWFSVLALILASAFFANTIATLQIEKKGILWFYVRLFITVCFVIIAYFVFYSMVRIYYPKSVEKRLKKIRNTPRISSSGNAMRKLDEEEDDAHLEPSQIAEEESNIHSVDYDVWLDDKTGEKKIEKYYDYQHAIECPSCGFTTFKVDKEEVNQHPTQTEAGLLTKHYKCEYCGHRESMELPLAKLSSNVK